MKSSDICLYLGPAARAELQALITNRDTPRKLVWRAEIVLATADGHGTFEIMRRARTSKPTVWRWQARYLDEGVAGDSNGDGALDDAEMVTGQEQGLIPASTGG